MTTYYIDSNFPDGGDGSIGSPFNTLSAVNSKSWPFDIAVKRGSILRENWTIPSMAGNTTQCTMYPYGTGKPPVLKPSNWGDRLINSTLLRNFLIAGDWEVLIDSTYSADYIVYLRANSEGSNNANVKVVGNMHFNITAPVLAGCISVYIDGIGGADITYRNDNLVVDGVTQRGGDSVVQIWAGSTYDLSRGQTVDHKGLNCAIRNCSAVGIIGDGYELKNARGMVGQETDPGYANSSRISNCFVSQNGRQFFTSTSHGRYHAGIWLYGCDKVAIEDCWADGGAYRKDCMGYDIDGRTSNSIVRRCVSTNNNGGCMMFTCTESNILEASMTSQATWENALITQERGNVNNRCEYMLSYNDGIGRGGYAGRYTLFQLNGNVLNATIKNVTIVDMMSKYQNHYYLYTPTAKGISMGLWTKYPPKIDSCLFYHKYKHMVASDLGYANNNGHAYMVWNKNNFYCPEDGGVSMRPSLGTVTGQQSVDPLFKFLPDTHPQGIDAAKMIQLFRTSTMFTLGSINTNKDIYGYSGAAIGWQQNRLES